MKSQRKVRKSRWYIIIEENLLNPIALRLNFKEKIYAYDYVEQYLSKKKILIVQGKELIEYGINILSSPLIHRKNSDRKYSNDTQTIYYFNPELSIQRRKTLRTVYRRRLKRNLLRLINEHSKRNQ